MLAVGVHCSVEPRCLRSSPKCSASPLTSSATDVSQQRLWKNQSVTTLSRTHTHLSHFTDLFLISVSFTVKPSWQRKKTRNTNHAPKITHKTSHTAISFVSFLHSFCQCPYPVMWRTVRSQGVSTPTPGAGTVHEKTPSRNFHIYFQKFQGKPKSDRHFVMSGAHVYNKCPFSV